MEEEQGLIEKARPRRRHRPRRFFFLRHVLSLSAWSLAVASPTLPKYQGLRAIKRRHFSLRVLLRVALLAVGVVGVLMTLARLQHGSSYPSYLPSSSLATDTDDVSSGTTPPLDPPPDTQTNKRGFHLLMAANTYDLNLCRTLASAAALQYPPPTLINWGKSWPEEPLLSHVAKVNGTLAYLRRLPASSNDDLVLLVDALDTHFQLGLQTLIDRYMSINAAADARLLTAVGPKFFKKYEMRQRVIFTAQKKCWPGSASDPWCGDNPPASPLPDDLYGPLTDTLLGSSDEFYNKDAIRPRYLNSGLIMGQARALRQIFERAVGVYQEQSHAGYNTSDQASFVRVWGRQEQGRRCLERAYWQEQDEEVSDTQQQQGKRHAATDEIDASADAKCHDIFPGLFPTGASAGASAKPLAAVQGYEEMGIGLDYASELSQLTFSSTADLRFIDFTRSSNNTPLSEGQRLSYTPPNAHFDDLDEPFSADIDAVLPGLTISTSTANPAPTAEPPAQHPAESPAQALSNLPAGLPAQPPAQPPAQSLSNPPAELPAQPPAEPAPPFRPRPKRYVPPNQEDSTAVAAAKMGEKTDPFLVNIYTGMTPALVHYNEHRHGLKERRQENWSKTWYFPLLRDLLEGLVTRERGGLWMIVATPTRGGRVGGWIKDFLSRWSPAALRPSSPPAGTGQTRPFRPRVLVTTYQPSDSPGSEEVATEWIDASLPPPSSNVAKTGRLGSLTSAAVQAAQARHRDSFLGAKTDNATFPPWVRYKELCHSGFQELVFRDQKGDFDW